MTPARDHRGHQHISPPRTGFYTLCKHSAGSDSSLGFKFAIETLKHSSFGCNDCLCLAFMSHMVNSGQVSQCMRSRHKWGRHSERYERLVSLSETRHKNQTYQTPPQCFCMTGAICWEGLTPWFFFFLHSRRVMSMTGWWRGWTEAKWNRLLLNTGKKSFNYLTASMSLTEHSKHVGGSIRFGGKRHQRMKRWKTEGFTWAVRKKVVFLGHCVSFPIRFPQNPLGTAGCM